MSGTVGIIANDNARYSLFSVRLTQLKTTVNTKLDWALTSDRILGRNTLAKRCIEEGSEWLLFIDDDHVFPDDLLLQLLSHEQPVVGALYLQRMVPFAPVAYIEKTEDEVYTQIDLTRCPDKGLLPVRAIGTGGMLIRSEVFREMEYPWFEHGFASEDLMFCDKLTELGIPIYCDLGMRLGHMTQAAIWPSCDAGDWSVGFTVADNFAMKVPIESPEDD